LIPAKADTRRQILDIAENLLLDLGYNGFSYKHISSALGIRNASIHYHFPQKSDLGVAIIQRARRRFWRWSHSEEMQKRNPLEKLDAFFILNKKFLHAGGQCCLGGVLETCFKTLPTDMQMETQAFISDMLGWLTELLRDGRERGAFAFPGDPQDQAIVIMSSLQGALQVVRATDPSLFEAAARQIRKTVKSEK